MVSAAWKDDGLDDWERELDRPDGRPGLALLAGTALIVVIAAIALNLSSQPITRHMAIGFGGAVVLAALVYAAGWVSTIRDVAPGWKIGIGLAYLFVALMAVLIATATARILLRSDITTASLVRFGGDGEPLVPRGHYVGPVTRRTLALARELHEQRSQESIALIAVGMDKIGQTWAVVGDPAQIRNCDRFAGVKPRIVELEGKLDAAVARYRGDLPALIEEPALLKASLSDVDRNLSPRSPANRRAHELVDRQLDLSGKICTVLARHHWQSNGTMFNFTTKADYDEFNALAGQWSATVSELRTIEANQNADADARLRIAMERRNR